MTAQVAARTCAARVDHELDALTEHQSAAQAVRDAAPVSDDGATIYTPETLRHAAQLDRAAAQCMIDAQTWQARWARAQLATYRHQCWCTARTQAARPVAARPMSLAQVAALHCPARTKTARPAPTGHLARAGCLATHLGSNAPGRDLAPVTPETEQT